MKVLPTCILMAMTSGAAILARPGLDAGSDMVPPTFQFAQPSTGTVQVAWAPTHGITDASPLRNPYAGGSWNYTLNPHATPAVAIISEFMAANTNGILDEDGTRADWVEI